jgi:N-acetylneuraminic acid mutarotase
VLPCRSLPPRRILLTIAGLGLAACQADSLSSEPEGQSAPRPQADVTAPAPNTWATGVPMPTARYNLVAATVNGIVYAIGGYGTGGTYGTSGRTVEAYNPSGSSIILWTPRAPLPAGRKWPSGAAVINGRIYVPGGENGSGELTKSLFMYRPSSDSWVNKAAMPVRSAHGAAGAINGKLYVFTPAINGTGPFLHRYDPATNTWTKRATPPHGNVQPAAGVIGGKLYLAGGADGSLSSALDVYDPATNTWTSRKSMPVARAYAAGAVLQGKLYVAGGTTNGPALGRVERYDPVSDTWATMPNMPTARNHLAAAAANGVLYALGGFNNALLPTNEAFTP